MAVVVKALSITMTANADAYVGDVEIVAITLRGATMTPAQILTLVDGQGSVVVDYIIPDTLVNADLWAGRKPQKYKHLTLTGPAAGSWVLTIGLKT